jgi:hypothetical protein
MKRGGIVPDFGAQPVNQSRFEQSSYEDSSFVTASTNFRAIRCQDMRPMAKAVGAKATMPPAFRGVPSKIDQFIVGLARWLARKVTARNY